MENYILDDDLRRYLTGDPALGREEVEQLEMHVEACGSCQDRLGSLLTALSVEGTRRPRRVGDTVVTDEDEAFLEGIRNATPRPSSGRRCSDPCAGFLFHCYSYPGLTSSMTRYVCRILAPCLNYDDDATDRAAAAHARWLERNGFTPMQPSRAHSERVDDVVHLRYGSGVGPRYRVFPMVRSSG